MKAKKDLEKNDLKLDFPFYNDNPPIKLLDIIILFIVPLFYTIYTFLPFSFPEGTGPYIFCFTQFAAILYVARGKISLIIKKPSFRDIFRVIVTLILQFIFSVGLAAILKYVLKIGATDNDVLKMEMNFKFWIAIIVQLFGEELYKLFIFLAVLIVINKTTQKRKLSIVVATLITLLCFAILHATTYNNIIQILLLQGLASFFSFYNYLKTKNILTAYMQHLLFDTVSFLLSTITI